MLILLINFESSFTIINPRLNSSILLMYETWLEDVLYSTLLSNFVFLALKLDAPEEIEDLVISPSPAGFKIGEVASAVLAIPVFA